VHVPVPQLIDFLGKTSTLGQSFQQANRSAATDIEQLFRARNKVAHRGEAVYRDATGVLQPVTRETLRKWWAAVEAVVAWVQALPD